MGHEPTLMTGRTPRLPIAKAIEQFKVPAKERERLLAQRRD
jgi:hypothetical protein